MKSTLHIVVGTKNPAKLRAVQSAFEKVFDQPLTVEGIAVASGVLDQPLSNGETLAGARNRVTNARKQSPNADFWVGVEAGIEEAQTFAWIVVSNGELSGESRSASLPLPERVMQEIIKGKELGTVMDELYGTTNIKQQGGAMGLLTHGRLSRSAVYHQALIMALTPFM